MNSTRDKAAAARAPAKMAAHDTPLTPATAVWGRVVAAMGSDWTYVGAVMESLPGSCKNPILMRWNGSVCKEKGTNVAGSSYLCHQSGAFAGLDGLGAALRHMDEAGMRSRLTPRTAAL